MFRLDFSNTSINSAKIEMTERQNLLLKIEFKFSLGLSQVNILCFEKLGIRASNDKELEK